MLTSTVTTVNYFLLFSHLIKIEVRIINNYWMRFCDIQNNQGWGGGYQPRPKAEDDNPYYFYLFIIHSTKKKWSLSSSIFSMSCLVNEANIEVISHASSWPANNTKHANLTWLPLPMYCGYTWHDYPWPWVTLTWLLYNLQVLMSRALISKIHCRLSANQKRVTELNV